MAQAGSDVAGLRAELTEARACLAERDHAVVLLAQENAALREQDAVLSAKLVALVDRVEELERRLGQTPQNSHKPPSSEGYEKPAPRSRRERTGRRSGGQPGHEGKTLRQVQTPDERVRHSPSTCGRCGSSLAGAPVVSTEARQVFELPEIALRVIEHALEHRRCGCGTVTMAAAPAGLGAPAQYGPGVRGFGTYLLTAQHLPLARTAELLTELLGAPISQGSLAGWYVDGAAGLDTVDEVLRDALTGAAVLGADETGIRVDGALAWVHAARTDTLTRYTVSGKRGVEAMIEAGVLAALSPDTVLVTDFWAPYWTFNVTHAVCGAHLGRELVSAAEVVG